MEATVQQGAEPFLIVFHCVQTVFVKIFVCSLWFFCKSFCLANNQVSLDFFKITLYINWSLFLDCIH